MRVRYVNYKHSCGSIFISCLGFSSFLNLEFFLQKSFAGGAVPVLMFSHN